MLIVATVFKGVASLLRRYGSPFQFPASPFTDKLQLQHLMSHCSGIRQHYVHSFSLKQGVPSMLEIMRGLTTDMGGVYSPLGVLFEPETEFAYSGGGFLMLQHVLELLWHAPIAQAMRPFMESLGMTEFLIEDDGSIPLFPGTADDGSVVPRRAFPPLAAGIYCVVGLLLFLTTQTTPRRHCLQLS